MGEFQKKSFLHIAIEQYIDEEEEYIIMDKKPEETKKMRLNPFLEDDACVGKYFTVSPMHAEKSKSDDSYDVYGSHGQILYMIGESVKVTDIDQDRRMVAMHNEQNTEGWENFQITFEQFQRDFGMWPPVELEADIPKTAWRTTMEQTVRVAADEIETSISYTLANNHACGVGNYWIDEQYNLFCETSQDRPGSPLYYLVKLERYKGEECVETEVYTESTDTLKIEELEKALRRILCRAKQDGIQFHDSDEPAGGEWFVTDPDCLQCCKIISEAAKIYEFVQINDYSYVKSGYRVARGTIHLEQYSEKEIHDNLHFFGYASMSDFERQNGRICWRLIAEMIFETNAASYETVESLDTCFSFTEIGAQIEQMTGMDLKEYYQE